MYGTTGILMKLRMEVLFFLVSATVAPACHHSLLADLGELALREAAVREADGHNGLRKSGSLGQAEQGDAVVTGALGVVRWTMTS